MKAFFTFSFILFVASLSFAQQSKWMKDEKNILTITLNDKITKAERLELKNQLWNTYKIRLDYTKIEVDKQNDKLKALSLKVEVPTGEIGTVGTTFIKPDQVIGFHYDRNAEAYDIFGVWTK